MILVGGIHGVGKSFFCKFVKERIHINSYSASDLIANLKQEVFLNDKLITDIDGNQPYLLKAIEKLNINDDLYLLDGHFCLLNSDSSIKRIEVKTFIEMNPQAIVLLIENPAIIKERRMARDGIDYNISDIDEFQQEESSYAKKVADILKVPLLIIDGANDFDKALQFIGHFKIHK